MIIQSVSDLNNTFEKKYQVDDLSIFPAGEGLHLVYAKTSHVARYLPADMLECLLSCQSFQTLDNHIQAYYTTHPSNPAKLHALRRELYHLANDGFFLSHESCIDVFRTPWKRSGSSCITSIGLITCNRVEALHRGLSSYIEYCKGFDRSNEFVVMDDSRSLDIRDQYRAMLRMVQKHYGLSILYAGYEEKIAFIQRLSNIKVIPSDVIAFACLGDRHYGTTTVGANRNSLLIHTVGELLFSSDDDIVCQCAVSPNKAKGVVLTNHGNPLEIFSFKDREQAFRAMNFVEQDILSLHEQWLGENPRVGVTEVWEKDSWSLDSLEPRTWHHFAAEAGNVALTLNGTIGDCSWDNPNYFLFQQGDSLKRLTNSEQEYRSVRASREMAQVVRQITITKQADPLFAMCMGLDNRELLPPFTPLGRAEDMAFGAMLTKCFPSTFTVHLPWMMVHAPFEARYFSEETMFSIGFNTWIPSCIHLFDAGFTRTPTERLHKLGYYLEEMGKLPKDQFEDFVRYHLWNSISEVISSCEERLQKESLPKFLVRDVQNYIRKARQVALYPIDQLYSLPGGYQTMQGLLIQFGQMIAWWPEIIHAAKQLRQEGYRLAQPL
jgi:hypothetical protein